MKRTFTCGILLLCLLRLPAQINFSMQTSGSTVTFSVTQMGNFYESVHWNFGDGTPTTFGYTVSHTYGSLSNFNVCAIGYPMPLAPPDTLCKSVNLSVTGLNEHSGIQTTVGPNPVKDRLHIYQAGTQPIGYSIINALGQVMASGKSTGMRSSIDMSAFTAGLYYVKLTGSEGERVVRVIKE